MINKEDRTEPGSTSSAVMLKGISSEDVRWPENRVIHKKDRTLRWMVTLKGTSGKLLDVCQPENRVIDKEVRTARSAVMLKGTLSKLSNVCLPENIE